MKNGRNKGKVGEREFAAFLREQGFGARRGQQFAGSAESPDVVCDGLPWLHIEVKRVEKLNLLDACVQAEGDCGGKRWIVAHRRNHGPWFITLRAEVFCEMARELGPEGPSGERVGRGESEQVRKWESGKVGKWECGLAGACALPHGQESERTIFGGAAGPWLPMTENKSTKSDRHKEKDRP